MHGTRMLRARSKKAAFLIVALLLVLVGCGGEPTEIADQPTEPVAAPTDTTEPTVAPTEEPEPTDVPTEPPPTDTPVPTVEPTPEPIDDSACIGCHTSEEALKAMATEEEAPEVESEGEG
jgi:outer membrane biosynthesis protein TonB